MNDSILDHIYGRVALLDEKPLEIRDWLERIPQWEHKAILAITFTTTKKTSVKVKFETLGNKLNGLAPIVKPIGVKVNRIPPYNQRKWFISQLQQIFGTWAYYFNLDWQKNREKLVHVHGLIVCPRHILNTMIVSIRQRAELLLQATQHDIREVHDLDNWIEYVSSKRELPSIVNN